MKIINLLLLIISVFTFCSCRKSSTSTDQYYVKYEVGSSTIYYGGKLEVLLRSNNNQIIKDTINTRSAWEMTIGPVKKGFNSNITINEIGNNYGHLTLQSQISVSKNSSAFAVKSTDNSTSPRTTLQINYTIDY